MIRYDLRCAETHEFDGWFHDSAAFERLAGLGLVECPSCGSAAVTKRLMTPAITRSARAPAPSAPTPAPGRAVTGPMPAELRAMLLRLRADIEQHCDYVGPGFAAAARDHHRAQADGDAAPDGPRGIYGEATEAEAEALADEGIEVARIPWVPRADS